MRENLKDTALEKRKFKRLNINCEVSYKLLNVKPPKGGKSKTKNISAGGICLIADEEIKLGSILGLRFNLADEKSPIKAKGKVVWANPFKIGMEKEHFDCGIEFTEITPLNQKIIDGYVFSYK